MNIKRKVNVFKIVNGKIAYTDLIKQAVLDPSINLEKIHMNDGWDWIDEKYKFIKLLLSRGQIGSIETHSDLLAKIDYMNAMKLGLSKQYSITVDFITKSTTKKNCCANKERMETARARWTDFCFGEPK